MYWRGGVRERLWIDYFNQWKSLLEKSFNKVAKYPESGTWGKKKSVLCIHRLGSAGQNQQFAQTSTWLIFCSIHVQSLDLAKLKYMSDKFKVSSGEADCFPASCWIRENMRREILRWETTQNEEPQREAWGGSKAFWLFLNMAVQRPNGGTTRWIKVQEPPFSYWIQILIEHEQLKHLLLSATI